MSLSSRKAGSIPKQYLEENSQVLLLIAFAVKSLLASKTSGAGSSDLTIMRQRAAITRTDESVTISRQLHARFCWRQRLERVAAYMVTKANLSVRSTLQVRMIGDTKEAPPHR